MKYMIIDRVTLGIIGTYEADAKDDSDKNRSWLAAEPLAVHLVLPEGIHEDLCEAILDENGEIKLQLSLSREKNQIDNAWEHLRQERNILLSESDRFYMPDFPIDQFSLEKIEKYRKSLRDLPSKVKDPRSFSDWPLKPWLK